MIRTIISAPKLICIYRENTTKETYDFLNEINSLVLHDEKLVTVDLSKVQQITAAASVLLFATVNIAQLMSTNPTVIRCIFPKSDINETGHRCIVKTGLARALSSGNIDALKKLTKDGSYYQSACKGIDILVPTLSLLTKKTKLTSHQLDLLIAGIAEAMLNVQHHAYKMHGSKVDIAPQKIDIVDKVGERWWQCAWYSAEKEAWVFIICDIGLGIIESYGKSLENSPILQDSSAEVLKNAFALGGSRFSSDGRGNGSEDMKRPIEFGAKEELLIYTGGYKYSYQTDMIEPHVINQSGSFLGTLIQWTLYSKDDK